MKLILQCLLFTAFLGLALPAAAQPQRRALQEMPAGPRVGDKAPDFKLRTKDGQREVQISSFKGQKPVVLVFGSFT